MACMNRWKNSCYGDSLDRMRKDMIFHDPVLPATKIQQADYHVLSFRQKSDFVQICFLLFGGYMLFVAARSSVSIICANGGSFYGFRFRPLSTSGHMLVSSATCNLVNQTSNNSRSEYNIFFEEEVRIDQLVLSILESNYPTHVQIFGSNNRGQSWTELGPSDFQSEIQTCEYNDSVMTVRFRFASGWVVIVENASTFVVAVCSLCIAVFRHLGLRRLERLLCSLSFLALGCLWSCAAVTCIIRSDSTWLFPCVWLGLIGFMMFAAILWAGSFLSYSMVALGVVGLVTVSVTDSLLSGGSSLPGRSACIASAWLTIVGSVLVLVRLVVFAHALGCFGHGGGSSQNASSCLQTLTRAESIISKSFEQLERICSEIAASIGACSAQQLGRLMPLDPSMTVPDGLSASFASDTADGSSEALQNLDQLYTQAIGLSSILQRKVGQWAAGLEPLRCTLSDARQPRDGDWLPPRPRMSHLEKHVSLGLIKSPARAIQKAALCYSGDVSRLTDLCRARVVCCSVGAMVRVLQEVSKGARVVQIKNYLDAKVIRRTRSFGRPNSFKVNSICRYGCAELKVDAFRLLTDHC